MTEEQSAAVRLSSALERLKGVKVQSQQFRPRFRWPVAVWFTVMPDAFVAVLPLLGRAVEDGAHPFLLRIEKVVDNGALLLSLTTLNESADVPAQVEHLASLVQSWSGA